jgi:hypothetical protein
VDDAFQYIETCALTVPSGPVVSTGGGGVFVTDVEAIGGIAANKIYEPDTVPPNVDLTQVTVDKDTVRIHFIAEGGIKSYTPKVYVDGILATNLTEDAEDKRHYYGYVDLVVTETKTVYVTSDAGGSDSVLIERAGKGPEIVDIWFGSYPGSQTELKAGDQIQVFVAVENQATSVEVLDFGAAVAGVLTDAGVDDAYSPGFKIATGTITISARSGNLPVRAVAKNSIGTYGDAHDSSGTLVLNQTYPVITFNSITYPPGQQALKGSETADVDATVSEFDTIQYDSPRL